MIAAPATAGETRMLKFSEAARRGSDRPITRRGLLQSAGAAALTAPVARAEPRRLPSGFVWGTSTSSYQIEGRGDRRADCIWDTFARLPGRIADGSNGEIACDHFHRYREDIALVANAGLKAYRYSICWPRVLPAGTGQIDPRGLDFYERLTDAVLQAEVEPWICLYHWDLPQALQDRGGWTNRASADWYAEYASLIARRLGDRATRWVMFNEAAVTALLGHGLGEFAPGIKGRSAMWAAAHHQNLAQGRGLAALRAIGGTRFQLGTVFSMQPVRSVDDKPANRAAAEMWDAAWNGAYLDPLLLGHYPARIRAALELLQQPGDLSEIRQPVDFVGVNYYSRMYQRADPRGLVGTNWAALPRGAKTTGMGWSIEPDGLLEVLTSLRDHYGNPPVFVTENGAAYAARDEQTDRIEDSRRIAYLHDHISVCHQAIASHCNLHGYFVWTLLDNFEWTHGFSVRFGLVHLDRATLKRTPKASYDWYSRVARSNALA
jgi:beta-glucosidase